jgi:ribosome-binding factor A
MIGSRQPFKRVDRVADLLRKIVSEALMTKVHHHGLEGVTVTDVHVSPDIKHARVYYRVMEMGKRVEINKELEKVRPIIQKELGSQMKTRNTPHLKFEYDESFEYGSRIDNLLASIRKNRSSEEA